MFRTLPGNSQFLNYSQYIPILRLQTTPRLLPVYSYSQTTPILKLIKTLPFYTTPTLIILPDHSNFQYTPIKMIEPVPPPTHCQVLIRHRDYSLSQITLRLFLFSDYSQTLSSLRTPTPTGNHLALSQISQRLLAPISNYSHTMPPLTSGMLAWWLLWGISQTDRRTHTSTQDSPMYFGPCWSQNTVSC